MRYFLAFILTILFGFSFGQDFAYPVLKSKGQNMTDFTPEGWTILDSAFGDLNKDGVKDAVMILQHKDSVSLVNHSADTILTQPRILAIFFKNASDHGFDLIDQSNSFILKHDNPAMEDPYQELTIKNGILEITFQLFYNRGSWYVTNSVYRLRYQQGQFVLIGADNFSIHRATLDYESYSYNFLTKKRALTKGNDAKGSKKTKWKAVNILGLKTLKTFSQPFTWQVEKGIYL